MAFTWHPSFETGNFRGVPKGTIMWQLWSAIEQRNQLTMIKRYDTTSPWLTPPSCPYPNSMSEYDWLQEASYFVLYLTGRNICEESKYSTFQRNHFAERNIIFLDYFPCGQVYYEHDLQHYRVDDTLIEDYRETTQDPRDMSYNYIPGVRLLEIMGFDGFIDPTALRRTPHSNYYEMLITQLYTFLSRMNCIYFQHYTRPTQPSNTDPFYNYSVRFGPALCNQTVTLVGRDLNTPATLSIDADGVFPQDWQNSAGINIGSFDIRPFLTEPFPLPEV